MDRLHLTVVHRAGGPIMGVERVQYLPNDRIEVTCRWMHEGKILNRAVYEARELRSLTDFDPYCAAARISSTAAGVSL